MIHTPVRAPQATTTENARTADEDTYHRLTANGVDAALRAGNLRFSPHLYDTPETSIG